jgi:hypothetical protein
LTAKAKWGTYRVNSCIAKIDLHFHWLFSSWQPNLMLITKFAKGLRLSSQKIKLLYHAGRNENLVLM